MRPIRILLIALLVASAPAAVGQGLDLSLPELGTPANQAMTPGEEVRLGRRLMNEVRRSLPLLEDPVVTGYVRDLGTRLASHSAGDGTMPFTFFVVDSAGLNAFAMPGGYIGVNRGLILAARSESELAAVMAHEIAHVTQRHLARRMAAQQGLTLRTMAMVLAGVLIGSQNPQAGTAAAITGMASSASSQLAYSRDHEREADRLGLRTLADAGFDPAGMPGFFERLMEESRYRREPLPFLSTHPLTRERIADTTDWAEKLPADDIFESEAFALVQARLDAKSANSADAALREFTRRVEKNGEAGAPARYGLAVALIRDGQHERAATRLHALLEEAARPAYYAALAENALAAGEPARAIEVLNDGLSLFPEDYALNHRRIEALIAADRPEDALRVTSEALARTPDSTALLALRAEAASAAGDTAEAALALGEMHAVRGQWRQALAQLERVEGGGADAYQRSRADAFRRRWQEQLEAEGES